LSGILAFGATIFNLIFKPANDKSYKRQKQGWVKCGVNSVKNAVLADRNIRKMRSKNAKFAKFRYFLHFESQSFNLLQKLQNPFKSRHFDMRRTL
jgi:hypothetical protein